MKYRPFIPWLCDLSDSRLIGCRVNCEVRFLLGDGRSKNGVPENEERVFGAL